MEIDPKRPLDPPPAHIKARSGLRVAGVVLVVVGGVVLLIGLSEFVMAFVRANQHDRRDPSVGRMILMMPGLLMLGIGSQMCLAGWAGKIAKYGVREGSPAAAEGINRVALGASEGIEAVAAAVASGVRGADVGQAACAACGRENDADAGFCDACGASMSASCSACGTSNDADATFCDSCGGRLAE